MDNLDLSAILSSPETMEKVMSVVKSLSGTQEQKGEASAPPADPPVQENAALPTALPADPNLVQSAMKIFAEYSREDDSIRLMRTLKSHLSEEAEVDKAIEVLRLSRSVRAILRMLKGGSHVLGL